MIRLLVVMLLGPLAAVLEVSRILGSPTGGVSASAFGRSPPTLWLVGAADSWLAGARSQFRRPDCPAGFK